MKKRRNIPKPVVIIPINVTNQNACNGRAASPHALDEKNLITTAT